MNSCSRTRGLTAGLLLTAGLAMAPTAWATDAYYRALQESREKAASDRAFQRYIYDSPTSSTPASRPNYGPSQQKNYSSELSELNAQSRRKAQWAEDEASERRMRERREARDSAARAREAELRALTALSDAAEAGDADALMTMGRNNEGSAFGSWGLPKYQLVFGPRRPEALWRMVKIIQAHPGDQALSGFRDVTMILGELAARGDAKAARELAEYRLKDRDYYEAGRFFTQAGQAGDSDARRRALRLVAEDLVDTLPLEPTVFYQWCREAGERGDLAAQWIYGRALSSGMETKKNPAEAMRWLRLAMAHDESKLNAAEQLMWAQAQERVGLVLLEGAEGVPADPEAGAELLLTVGKGGYTPALRQLGLAYLAGQGVEAERKVGLDYLRRAAEEGDAPAAEALALAYLTPEATEGEATEGLRWLLKVAKRGPRAMIRYGQILFDGEYGIPRDPEAAVEILSTAVDHYPTDPEVLDFVGWSYLQGRYGLAAKPDEGVRALALAVEQGNRVAARRLERLYREGTVVTANPEEAQRWKMRAEAME